MFISWKSDSSFGSADAFKSFIEEGDFDSYSAWAVSNGRVNFKHELVGEDLVYTEEWNITTEEYDALDHPSFTSQPIVETTDHLTF